MYRKVKEVEADPEDDRQITETRTDTVAEPQFLFYDDELKI